MVPSRLHPGHFPGTPHAVFHMAPFFLRNRQINTHVMQWGSRGQKMKFGKGGESRNMISLRASRRGFLEEALAELKTGP